MANISLYLSNSLKSYNMHITSSRVARIFQNSRRHLKILGARKVTWIKFHITEGKQKLRRRRRKCTRSEFVHPWTTVYSRPYVFCIILRLESDVFSLNGIHPFVFVMKTHCVFWDVRIRVEILFSLDEFKDYVGVWGLWYTERMRFKNTQPCQRPCTDVVLSWYHEVG
jgi:hypothetical protein